MKPMKRWFRICLGLMAGGLVLLVEPAVKAINEPPGCQGVTITNNPVSVTRCLGSSATFSVAARGSLPLYYQWLRHGAILTDGGSVSGSTTPTLRLAGLTAGDSGFGYKAVVSNNCQGVASSHTTSSATLTVSTASSLTATISGPSQATFATTNTYTGTSGYGLTYSWSVTGQGAIIGSADNQVSVVAGAGCSFTLQLTLSNGNCTDVSSVTVPVIPVLASISGPREVCAGAENIYVGPEVPGLNYQWTISDHGTILSATSDQSIIVWAGTNGGSYTLTLTNYTQGCDSIASNGISITVFVVDGVEITAQPVSQVACPSDTATLSVGAVGSSLTYQWQKNGVNLSNNANISGANSATLTINDVGNIDGYADGFPSNSTVYANNRYGTHAYNVVAGRTYWYTTSGGCMEYYDGYSDPDGYLYPDDSCSNFVARSVTSDTGYSGWVCPGLIAHSLVGKVGNACIQLGKHVGTPTPGSFVAPATGTLVLYYNEWFWTENAGSWGVMIEGYYMGDTYDVIVSNSCGSQTCAPVTLGINNPSLWVSGSATICAGESTMIRARLTGTPPWTVTWNDGFIQSNIQASPATRVVSPTSTTNYYATSISDAYCTVPAGASGLAHITVVTPGNSVAKPAFSPQPGAYTSSLSVTVSCDTAWASIHYTTNGLMPTMDDPSITSGSTVALSRPTILKARAFTNGYCASDVKAGLYQIGPMLFVGWDDHDTTSEAQYGLGLSFLVWTNGNLWGWGSSYHGSLGTNVPNPAASGGPYGGPDEILPFPSSYATNLINVASGEGRTSFVDNSGSLSQSGDNTESFSASPLGNLVSVSQGFDFSIALKTDGTVIAWGKNSSGQLGRGTVDDGNHTTPVQVGNLTDVIAIAAGHDFAIALRNDGTVWGWGSDCYGQMGDCTGCPGELEDCSTNWPTRGPIGGVSGVVAIAAGNKYAVVLEADGTVWTWGDDVHGQLGTGESYVGGSQIPMQVPGLSNVVGVATPVAQNSPGYPYTLAWTAQGQAFSWGYNVITGWIYGLLGTGDTTDLYLSTPQLISTLTNVCAMSAAGDHAVAETMYKGVYVFWSWGRNDNGQLGDGTTITRTTPTLVHFPSDTNGDGMPDWQKCQYGLDPFNRSQNGDGLLNGTTLAIGFNPADNDINRNGYSNIFDILNGYNPFDPSNVPDQPPVSTFPVISLSEPTDAALISDCEWCL